MKIIRTLAVVAGFALACSPAYAVNLVQNPSFETGTTANWTIVNASCTWDSLTVGVDTTGAGNFFAPAPTNGTRILLGDDLAAGQSCQFYQDIVLPAGTTNTLTFDAGANFSGGANTVGDALQIEITTTGNVVLATFYTRNGTQGNDAVAARGPFNLNAYAGQTVRLRVNRTNVAAPVGVILDNVVLDSVPAAAIPTLGEWAMILLGLCLAGAGAVHLSRRRVV